MVCRKYVGTTKKRNAVVRVIDPDPPFSSGMKDSFCDVGQIFCYWEPL